VKSEDFSIYGEDGLLSRKVIQTVYF